MGKPTGYTIVLVRTGPTDWEASGRLNGRTDLPMNAEGESAFHQAVHAFFGSPSAPEFSTILISPEEPTQKGAAILNFGRSAKVRELEGLVNVGLGLWEGELANQLEDRCKTAYREWIESPMRITPPQGESLIDAQERLVEAVIKGLKKAKGDHPTIAVVLRPMAWALVRAWMLEIEPGKV
ncbi:MAG: histidine phosphatase family protein, partial [Phycisphaerales bacterium]|nr:histidine phosphatase family protein [Phycisphaerales bacterium]